jgi:hypothetical protein
MVRHPRIFFTSATDFKCIGMGLAQSPTQTSTGTSGPILGTKVTASSSKATFRMAIFCQRVGFATRSSDRSLIVVLGPRLNVRCEKGDQWDERFHWYLEGRDLSELDNLRQDEPVR